MFDYYSRHSLLRITQPLSLVGFWGVRIPEIGVALSQISGVSTVDVERQVEHKIGMRLNQFLTTHSSAELIELEYSVLRLAIGRSSRPVIVFMRPQCFLHPPTQKLLLENSHCIHIKRGLFTTFSHIHNVLERTERTRHFTMPLNNPKNINDVAELLKAYNQAYSNAHRCIDVDSKHPLKIAQDLFTDLSA